MSLPCRPLSPGPSPGVLDRCTSCGRCRTECAFLATHGTPREVVARFRSDPGAHRSLPFACSLCGLCEAVCPGGVPVVDEMRALRRDASDRFGGFRAHRRVLAYEAVGSSRAFRLHRIPDGCRAVFFPGCALPGNHPNAVLAAYRHLRKDRPDLGIVLDCCSKSSHDLGLDHRFAARFGRLRQALLGRGVEEVWTGCPSCFQVWDRCGAGMTACTVYERLEPAGSPSRSGATNPVVVHDPCTLRDRPAVHRAVRDLVRTAVGRVEEPLHRHATALCCGEGGAVGFVAPALADTWARRRAAEAGGRTVVTYCAGCEETLGRHASTVHLLDLLFPGGASRAGTLRRYRNRLWLKRALRREAG